MNYFSLRYLLKNSVPVLLLCAALTTLSGSFLNRNEEILKYLPGLVIIIPSFVGMSGNISSVIASRLSSVLHLGLIKPVFRKNSVLNMNLYAMIIISLVAFPSLGLAAGIISIVLGFGGVSLVTLTIITSAAGIITEFVLIFTTIIVSYATFRRGLDPDNVVIPILTTLGDFTGIFVLMAMAALIV